MALTKISRGLLSTGISDSSDATAITIDSSENVGIGVTPSTIWSTSYDALQIGIGGSISAHSSAGDALKIGSNFVYEGTAPNYYDKYLTTSTAHKYELDADGHKWFYAASGTAGNAISWSEAMRIDSSGVVDIKSGGSSSAPSLIFEGDTDTGFFHGTNVLAIATAGSERMRIDASGNLLIGKTSLGNNTIGTEFKYSGGLFNITNSGSQCMTVNRLTNDGSIVIFQQDTTTEGSITVSGATVSYNGFSGSHESSGVASDTAIGTVCSTIDELDTYVSGTKEGQTRADHAKIKVSDTAGDVRVYGVLSSFSEEDNKPVVASVGIGSVLVTGACAGGDLLESNGDGTAKVQDDDIIRSKTIGKVTIGNTTTSVKLVSCVLYCG